ALALLRLFALSLHDALPIYPGVVSPAALDDALNIMMHAGTLFIVLYALRSHGISIKKMIGGYDLQNSGLMKWLGYSFLFKAFSRSEEHTSELQSRFDLVCRL